MSTWLDVVLVLAALALAVLAGLWALRDRPMPFWQMVAAGVVELLVLAVVVVAVVSLIRGSGPDNTVVVVGYLVAMPLILPFGVVTGLIERTRYGSVVLAVMALVVTVLVFRLHQLFGAVHG